MSEAPKYPKRLIEVDLPIKRISAHARREKSIRHGNISTLHIWWARRPLAACRAVICAALWPDPADPLCPKSFRVAVREALAAWATTHLTLMSPESFVRFNAFEKSPSLLDDPEEMRNGLLDFLADFSNWDNSTNAAYLEMSRVLTQQAHESLGGAAGTRPLVVDPFSGGGAIPLEALRVGADAFASDINPVSVAINRVTLAYGPKFREELIEGVKKWGAWVQTEALRRLAPYYPSDRDGGLPVTYLWARTVQCEGPSCGAEIPLLGSLWLAKRGKRSTALRPIVDRASRSVTFEIITGSRPEDVASGTSKGGAATCCVCGFTTPVESVRAQLLLRHGGAKDARLMSVLCVGKEGRSYRLPTPSDLVAVERSRVELIARCEDPGSLKGLPLIPEGEINHLRGFFNIVLYGTTTWGDLFSSRQLLSLTTLCEIVRDLPADDMATRSPELARAIRTVLALVIDRVAVRCTANCIWDSTTECIMQLFNQGQSLPARWEFAEMCPVMDSGSGWNTSLEYTVKVLEHLLALPRSADVHVASATNHPLPDDAADAIITDPPYYAAIPYADLSDFFFSWLQRSLCGHEDELLGAGLVPKEEELVSLAHRAAMYRYKTNTWFEEQMGRACREGRRVCIPSGLGVWVFANKETAAWEAMLAALISAGWIVTASWPIDTESGNRLRAKDSAALASSVHLVCRPREAADGSLRMEDIGSWKDVLSELPVRMHEWMPRLAREGVVGADAIFACLGPALEVFSRYSRVEKVSGEVVLLPEFLEQVWGAVSKEALSMIFRDAETAGLEPDARITAMWLWTIAAPSGADGGEDDGNAEDEEGGASDAGTKGKKAGFALEYDAARKIAQGLGATLENLTSVIEVKGDKARLLSVGERARALFAKSDASVSVLAKKAAKKQQMKLFEEEIESAAEEQGWDASGAPTAGKTALDRVHQAMLLFGTGRSEALKRFLVEEGAGRQASFWKLAQALSALYPPGCDEKRWVDGVLVRKKGLGF